MKSTLDRLKANKTLQKRSKFEEIAIDFFQNCILRENRWKI